MSLNRGRSIGACRAELGVIASGMSAFLNMYVTQALLPSLRTTFHASITALSLTVTLTTLAVAVAAPLAGSLSDRYGRRKILLGSLSCLTVATFLAASAPSLGWLLVWRLIQGLFIPGVFTATVAHIGEEWPAARAPTVTALYVSGTVFGSFCGRFLAGLITSRYNWQIAFLTLGMLNLAFIPLIAWTLPAPRRFRPARSMLASLSGLGIHLHNRKLLATYGIGFGILFSQVATFTYVSFHLAGPPFGLDLHQLSFIFCVFLIGMAITPLSGIWAARIGQRKMFVVAMIIGSMGLALTLQPSLSAVIVGLTLSSAGVFVAQAMATSLISRFALNARSSAVGLYVTTYYLGGSVGGVLPSAAWNTAGWGGCVALVILVQATIAALAWRAWHTGAEDTVVRRGNPRVQSGR